MTVRLMNWSPQSWRAKPALQQPKYDDAQQLEQVVDDLRALPPLVTAWEIEQLKQLIAEAAAGKRFLLQGGDCAETFSECRADVITNKVKVLLQMCSGWAVSPDNTPTRAAMISKRGTGFGCRRTGGTL